MAIVTCEKSSLSTGANLEADVEPIGVTLALVRLLEVSSALRCTGTYPIFNTLRRSLSTLSQKFFPSTCGSAFSSVRSFSEGSGSKDGSY
ncbi:unnamed protein product [Periconia digitata]|uniref:Uncharacterized protein n=1 Tax=Periconia digitata TaxID=1303443 RepID=A0A9W4XJN8_9PLEO|nr:unnamed protein product [Periconia digitata]